jgi:ABC-2 type transport system permease protein
VNALAILVVAVLGYGAELGIANPVLFLLTLVLTLASLSALGVVFCSSFLLTRSAQLMTNGLEMPIYVASGSMFPIALLPFWSHPFSWILGPTWGIDAMRIAASYGTAGMQYWTDVLVLIASTIAYLAVGFWLFIVVEKKVRRDATLTEY